MGHPVIFWDRILVCGKVKNFCFDKTGTLTKSGLSFYGIVPIDNGKFGASISLDRYGNLVQGSDLIILAIACTHELLLGQMPEGESRCHFSFLSRLVLMRSNIDSMVESVGSTIYRFVAIV